MLLTSSDFASCPGSSAFRSAADAAGTCQSARSVTRPECRCEMSLLNRERVSGLVSAGHQGVWGGDGRASLHPPLASAAGGPGAVGPAEVGSISLGKMRVFSYWNTVLPHLLQRSLKPEIAVPKLCLLG